MQVAKYPETIVGPFWGHSQLLQHSSCVREEGEVEVSPELLNGAATPVLKHVQVGLALELEGRSGAP